MRTVNLFFIILFALGLISSSVAQTGYQIIANESVEAISLSKSEISKIFLKKKTSWPNDNKMMPVDLVSTSSVREKFSKEIHGKGVNAIMAYWQRQIFSGRSVPPPEKKSDKEVISYIKATPGAIGYVSDKTNTSGVKVIDVAD